MSGRAPGSARGRSSGRGGRGGDRGGDRGGRGGDRGRDRGGSRGRGGRGSFDLPTRPAAGFVSESSQRGGRGGYRGDQGSSRGGPRGARSDSSGLGDHTPIYSPGYPAAPNPEVEKIENAVAQSIQKKQPFGKGMPVGNEELPLRPGYGSVGRKVLLWANYFEMTVKSDLELFRYSVAIAPDENGKVPVGKKLKQIIRLLIQDHFPAHAEGIATDGKANLISVARLRIDEEAYSVPYRSEEEMEMPPNPKVYRVRVQDSGSLTVFELVKYLASTSVESIPVSKEDIIQALNIVVGYHPKTAESIFSVGANKHFQMKPPGSEIRDLGGYVNCIRGLFASVRTATSRLLVNVQVKHVTVYHSISLGKLMWSYWCWLGAPPDSAARRAGQLPEYGNDNDWGKVSNFLKGLKVHSTHLKDKKGKPVTRLKTIFGLATVKDGVTLTNPPKILRLAAGPTEIQFWKEDKKGTPGPKGKKAGVWVSISEHFKTAHGLKTSENMPVVNVGSRKDPSYLPVEACHLLPNQLYNFELERSQRDEMVNFAVRSPNMNAQSIVQNAGHIMGFGNAANPTLEKFKISVPTNLLAVPGRVLSTPRVMYSGKTAANTNAGSWNMRDVRFAQGTVCEFWSYINFYNPRRFSNEAELKNALDEFGAALRKVDVNVKRRLDGANNISTASIYAKDPLMPSHELVKKEIGSFRKSLGEDSPKILLIILPDDKKPLYKCVKTIFDTELGVRNVCVVSDKFCKRGQQYYANVALKFNLKLGGKNQVLDPHQLGIIGQGNTMVVGIDVTHPSPGSGPNAPSVAGIVASTDMHLAQWPASLHIQSARREMVSALGDMLVSRLDLWKQHNKQILPENILIYRDGVSEGQYNVVLQEELPLLRQACKEVYPATATEKGLPRLSIIVVGKRHNTRFYPTKPEDASRSNNPRNGTVVDRGVTDAKNWDFFLQAHDAIKGTARPAHYYVILDEIFRRNWTASQMGISNPAEALEDLTHKMCYLFGRATKAVSICPAAYYADLVCERARCYVRALSDATPAANVKDDDTSSVASIEPQEIVIHPNVRDSMFYV